MKGLYFAKAWYTRRLEVFINYAQRRNLSPDLFTWLGVGFAVVAAAAFILGWWPLVILGLAGRLAGANLDGAVARRRCVSRPFGFVLNEIGDRVSDYVILAGVAVAAYQSGSTLALVLSLAAFGLAAWPSIISISGAGAGGARLNGGPFGKTERCAVVALASIAMGFGAGPALTLSILASLIIVGSLVTGVTRTLTLRRQLGQEAE